MRKAKLGELVTFSRGDQEFNGRVSIINPNSVIVEISKEDARTLDYETNYTVVNHRRYRVKQQA
ncbi:YkvS family protein [Sutcliffiella horikoshii]|uniref:DUF2187 family protein n=1 Tax=Sutcliffiella horikoshii TaxID=79883 RepID=UPI001CC12890|nr:DUF2187 family protein [Sutcliffiella horikoshii]MCM3619641.1 YkvS family protein [Sutcliffiella horikoshii]UAL49811.1 YkvS family protein [Sutcliffiella horikoshii]